MAENILLDGAIPTPLTKEFNLEFTDSKAATIVVANSSGDIALELKAGAYWVPIDVISAAVPSLGIYTVGRYRVVAGSLAATEVVSLHR